MKIVDKSTTKYNEVVEVLDNKNYNIDTNTLQEDEYVVCPYDSDMLVTRKNNKIIVIKKSFRNPNI